MRQEVCENILKDINIISSWQQEIGIRIACLFRIFMEELVEYIERTPKARHAHRWKNYLRSLPPPLSDVKSPKTWQTVYSLKAISEALSHVRVLAYKEKVVRNTGLCISENVAYFPCHG